MVVLDTCALLWWTLQPEMLSKKAKNTCDKINQTGGLISSISIWEIGIKVRKGQIQLGLTLDEYVERLKKLNTLEIVSVDESIWIANLDLVWKHRDPVDRTIVATAKQRGLGLVTKDDEIRRFYRKSIW